MEKDLTKLVDTVGIEPNRSPCKGDDLPSVSGPCVLKRGFEPLASTLSVCFSTRLRYMSKCAP